MKLTFIGTGEAFDENRDNTSYLIENKRQYTLVDCGYTASGSLRRFLAKKGKDFIDVLDNIMITHLHGDHFSGLSGLLIPLWDQVRDSQRERKLTITSAYKTLQDTVESRMFEDYPGLYEKFRDDGLKIEFSSICLTGGVVGSLDVKWV